MRKAVLLSISLVVSLSGYAFDFLAGGLKYSTNIDGTSVTVIRQDTSIKKAVIPDKVEYNGQTYKVTSIGAQAFSECMRLNSITISSSVTSIGRIAFDACDSLSMFSVSKKNPCFADIDGVLFNKNKDTLLAYPNLKAKRYVIPSGVVAIYEDAFSSRDNLRSLTIPESVRYIGKDAFSGCFDYLAEVFCQAKTPPTIGFYRIGSLPGCIFYVPKSTGKIYSSTPGWTYSGVNRINIMEKETVTTYNVTLKEAGTLSETIGKDNLSKVIKLTISGPINGTDIKTIRSKLPLLRILDLGDADIVSGGESYFTEKETTMDNVIGDYMFENIRYWESIVLPKNVSRIGEHAFLQGIRLQSITLLTKSPPAVTLSSFMLNVNCKLYVPKGTEAAYAQADGWKRFYTDYGNK